MKFWRRQHEVDLELELRNRRPEPSAALEARVLAQIATHEPVGHASRRRTRRLILAFVVVAIAVLASLGGVGYAASSTVEAASSTVHTVTNQTSAVVKVVKHAVRPAKNDKPKVVTAS